MDLFIYGLAVAGAYLFLKATKGEKKIVSSENSENKEEKENKEVKILEEEKMELTNSLEEKPQEK